MTSIMITPPLALAVLLALASPSPQRKPLPCELTKVDPPKVFREGAWRGVVGAIN